MKILFTFAFTATFAAATIDDLMNNYADVAHKVRMNEDAKRPTEQKTRAMVESAREHDNVGQRPCPNCGRTFWNQDEVPTVEVRLAAPKKNPWSSVIGEVLQEREQMEASFGFLFAKEARKRLIEKMKKAQKKKEEEAKKSQGFLAKRTAPVDPSVFAQKLAKIKFFSKTFEDFKIRVPRMAKPSPELLRLVKAYEKRLNTEEKNVLEASLQAYMNWSAKKAGVFTQKDSKHTPTFQIKVLSGAEPFESFADELAILKEKRIEAAKKMTLMVKSLVDQAQFVQRDPLDSIAESAGALQKSAQADANVADHIIDEIRRRAPMATNTAVDKVIDEENAEVRTELDHAATGQACTGVGCSLFAQDEDETLQDGQQQINVALEEPSNGDDGEDFKVAAQALLSVQQETIQGLAEIDSFANHGSAFAQTTVSQGTTVNLHVPTSLIPNKVAVAKQYELLNMFKLQHSHMGHVNRAVMEDAEQFLHKQPQNAAADLDSAVGNMIDRANHVVAVPKGTKPQRLSPDLAEKARVAQAKAINAAVEMQEPLGPKASGFMKKTRDAILGSSAFMQRGDQNVNILYENGRYTAPNQDVTEALEKMITHGSFVETANDARETREVSQAQKPDVVNIEFEMPKRSTLLRRGSNRK